MPNRGTHSSPNVKNCESRKCQKNSETSYLLLTKTNDFLLMLINGPKREVIFCLLVLKKF